ncbi:MAG: MFS transporter [Solirubrobacteraceae bacterium]
MASVLDSHRVRRIVGAFTLNRLGGWFGLVALLVLVFDHTHNALAVSALLLAWQALPAFVVPALVTRVESSVHGHELSGLYFVEAAATCGLAILAWRFWLPGVLILAAIDGTAALAASALLRAALARAAREHAEALIVGTDPAGSPEKLAEEAEQSANATLNIAFSVTFVAGPALGGLVVATSGAATALFIDVGSFLLCGALLLDLHPHVDEAGADSVRARLAAAWRHVNEQPGLRTLLLVYAVALAMFETAAPIEVAFVKETLNAGDRGLGLLLTCWGAGAVLGSVIFARLRRRSLPLMLGAGTLAIGLADAGFALAPTLALTCAAAVLGGLGNGVELPALVGLVQALAPSRLHGRLMGAVESLTAFAVALGLAAGGALVALSSTRFAFAAVAVATILVAATLLHLGRRGERAGSGAEEPGSETQERLTRIATP